jgi:hypothetical protein
MIRERIRYFEIGEHFWGTIGESCNGWYGTISQDGFPGVPQQSKRLIHITLCGMTYDGARNLLFMAVCHKILTEPAFGVGQ